jgi:hypothetical protein
MSDFCINFNIVPNDTPPNTSSSDPRYCPNIELTGNISISETGSEDGVPYIIINGINWGVGPWGNIDGTSDGDYKFICSPLLFGKNSECKPYIGSDVPYGTADNPFIEYVLLDKDGNYFEEGPNYTPGPADLLPDFAGYNANGEGVYYKRVRGEIIDYSFYSTYQHTCDSCIQDNIDKVCVYSSPLNGGVLKIKDTGLSKACSIKILFKSFCGWPGMSTDMVAGEISEIYVSDIITRNSILGALYAPEVAAIKDSFGDWIYACSETIIPEPIPSNLLFNTSSFNRISSGFYRGLAQTAANNWYQQIRIESKILDQIRLQNKNWNGIELVECFESNEGLDYIAACEIIDSYDIIDDDIYNIKFIPLKYNLYINTFFLNNSSYSLTNQDWLSTLMHELGHALGVAEWNASGPWLDGSIYESTREAYRLLTGGPPNRLLIPIEDEGVPGTVGVHWENDFRNEEYPGSGGFVYPPIVDIMLPYLKDIDSSDLSTNLSVPYLIDQGFVRPPSINAESFRINTVSDKSVVSLPRGFCGFGKFKKSVRPCSGLIDLRTNTFISYK